MDETRPSPPPSARKSWWLPPSVGTGIALIVAWSGVLALNLFGQPWPPPPLRIVSIILLSALVLWSIIGLLVLVRRQRADRDRSSDEPQ